MSELTSATTPSGSKEPRLLLAEGLFGVLAILALTAVLWTPYPVDTPDMAVALQDPGSAHWLGTDPAGRDVISLLMKGLLTSFVLSVSALILAAIIGVPCGMVSARWRTGLGMLNGARTMLALYPAIGAAVLFATLWGASGLTAVLALALSNVAPLALATCNAFAAFQSRGYVEAARLAGLGGGRATRHVLSPILHLVLAEAARLFGFNVAAEAGLTFVGLGVQPPAHSLGLLLHDAQSYMAAKPLLTLLPGLLLTVLIVASALAAEGLKARASRGGSVGPA